ncbi:uncharacterized protein L201_003862 [Kwoniella dendrophila CBS 6074]|uniref:Barwin domain-containing protein n=1 Tax=Kwoniella dendrophila CBS 6074 TaxID=1295534 RepID=A0AAX4JWG2_9TREE
MFVLDIAAAMALLQIANAAKATLYYDGAGLCGKEGDVDQGVTHEFYVGQMTNYGACGYSAEQMGDNRFVAFDASLMGPNPAAYCGKEIQVYKADGTLFKFSEGPLFIGDACPGCSGGSGIDISSQALTEINGGNCKTNPEVTYKVLDNFAGPKYSNIPGDVGDWKGLPGGSGAGGGETAANSSSAAGSGAESSISVVPDSSSPATVPPVAPAASTPVVPANNPIAVAPSSTLPADPTKPAADIAPSPSLDANGLPSVNALFAEKSVDDSKAGGDYCKRRKRRLDNDN